MIIKYAGIPHLIIFKYFPKWVSTCLFATHTHTYMGVIHPYYEFRSLKFRFQFRQTLVDMPSHKSVSNSTQLSESTMYTVFICVWRRSSAWGQMWAGCFSADSRHIKSSGSWSHCLQSLCSQLSSAMHEDLSVAKKNLCETQYFCLYSDKTYHSLSQPYYLH